MDVTAVDRINEIGQEAARRARSEGGMWLYAAAILTACCGAGDVVGRAQVVAGMCARRRDNPTHTGLHAEAVGWVADQLDSVLAASAPAAR